MRDLDYDLKWLDTSQFAHDLNDSFLESKHEKTRINYRDRAVEFVYGITFVESDIAREWLERAIEAEKKLEETMLRKEADNG